MAESLTEEIDETTGWRPKALRSWQAERPVTSAAAYNQGLGQDALQLAVVSCANFPVDKTV